MKQQFYRIFYSPLVNSVVISLLKLVSKGVPNKWLVPPSHEVEVEAGNARFKLKTNQSNTLTKLVYYRGALQYEYTAEFLALLPSVRVFIDVGASIGYYSLIAASANRTCKVIAFEPAQGPFNYLRENAASYGERIQVNETALSSEEGTLEFAEQVNHKYTYLKHNLAGQSRAADGISSAITYKKKRVQATTLSQFALQANLSAIDLIKMDTEGTEPQILEAGAEAIDRFRPIVICETLFNMSENQLEDFFKPRAYTFWNHTEKGMRREETIKRSVDNGIRNCFFVPEEKLSLLPKAYFKASEN